jgi:hypothetical protein
MKATMQNAETLRSGAGAAQLWFGILAGPLAWAFDEGVSYSLVPHACSTGHHYVLHIVTIISFAIVIGGFLAARIAHARIPSPTSPDGGSTFDRSRFMALLGMASSSVFILVIIAQTIPRFILGPCD